MLVAMTSGIVEIPAPFPLPQCSFEALLPFGPIISVRTEYSLQRDLNAGIVTLIGNSFGFTDLFYILAQFQGKNYNDL
jgi:hypothetical protein